MRDFMNKRGRGLKLAVASVGTAALGLAVSASAFAATETPTEEKVSHITSSIGTEGVSIFLLVVGGLTALLTAVVVVRLALKKGLSLIK